MRKYIGFLLLSLFCSAFLQAESVWTGNAKVGSLLQFPGSREYFRAASNSFPLGTILKVTKPRGRASVEVIVIDRLDSPGIFLLMEMNAAKKIGIPSDYIHPVQVTPIGSSDLEIHVPADESGSGDEASESLPNNRISAYLENEENDTSAVLSQEEESTTDAIIASELTMIDDPGEYSDFEEPLDYADAYSSGKTKNPSPVVSHEAPDIAIIPEETAAEEAESDTGGLIESESQILFLSPSDFRPPEGTVTRPIENTSAAEEVNFDTLAYKPGDTGKYIQIGAYLNREVLDAKIADIQRSNPDYPLRVASTSLSSSSDQILYKLLVGPIKPAEIGVVLDTVRRNKFPDAFPFVK